MIVRAKLEPLDGSGKSYALELGQAVVIGRGRDAGIVLSDDSISRRHARFELRPEGQIYVTDLHSKNGVTLAGEQVPAGATIPLPPGAPVVLGSLELRVELLGQDDGSRRRRNQQQRDDLSLLPEDEFEILGLLGQGGVGSVYGARHRASGRPVVIKVLRPESYADPDVRRRFETEARIAMRIDSRFVVRVYELRVLADRTYHVAEWLRGQSLLQRIRESGPLPVGDVIRLGAELSSGLSAIHRAGAIHRDVKPANVILTEDRAVLTDFGVAKDVLPSSEDPATAYGEVWGTMGYIAPELLRVGGQLTPAADVFALGVTVFQALTGRLPFSATRRPVDYLASVLDGPLPLHQAAPGTPAALSQLVKEMLAPEPALRPADGDEAAAAFAGLIPTANRIQLDQVATSRRAREEETRPTGPTRDSDTRPPRRRPRA